MRRPALAVLILVAACDGGSTGPDADIGPDAEVAPAFRNPVAMPDDQLALRALQLLGAQVQFSENRCNGCHALTRQHIRYWRTLSDSAMADCFTDLAVTSVDSAHHTIDCFRAKPENPSAQFMTDKLGVYASAARLPWFAFTFRKAYAGSTTELDGFIARSGMPPSSAAPLPYTQAEFDIVAEWFIRGCPMLDDILPEDPPPDTCFPSIDPEVATHVASQATDGWRARNLAAGINMYGCGGATDPRLCLAGVPLASSTTFGTGWDVPGYGTNRVLKVFPTGYGSAYWTRSSADGRFVAHGSQGTGSSIVDLQDGGRIINVNAAYDPAFFPDNSGFVFQGGPRNVCVQSILLGAPASISMTEIGCSNLGQVGLYEHVGAVPGGDYFSVDGLFVSDDGGHFVTLRDPSAFFGQTSEAGITPMIFTGTVYTPKPSAFVPTPYEGDAVISPSAKLLISRLAGPGNRQLGYVMRKVIATPNGSSYDITAPEIARYCLSGGKPAFSLDEQWIVYQHYIYPNSTDAQELGYVDVNDPGFQAYRTDGGANIYLLQTTTGTVHRITRMNPGQYALYPHFRSDGWIYYQVRDRPRDTEYTVASDAALLLE